MSRPQFASLNSRLRHLSLDLYPVPGFDPVQIGHTMRLCELRFPWLKAEGRPPGAHGSLNSGPWRALWHVYCSWTAAGCPHVDHRLSERLRCEVLEAAAGDILYRRTRERLGGRRADPNRAGWRELDITYSCGCSGGMEWMRVDARGNLRDEEVAILAAKEYYHRC